VIKGMPRNNRSSSTNLKKADNTAGEAAAAPEKIIFEDHQAQIESNNPKQKITAQGQNNPKLREKEIVNEIEKLKTDNEQLKKQTETVKEKIDAIEADEKQPVKLEEQANSELVNKVQKLEKENKNLKKSTETGNEKLEKIEKISKDPSNEEKVDIVGGVGGIVSTIVEQLTGTGEFETHK